MNRAVRYGVACLLVLAGTPALALYRCGNVFQDKPCESGPEIRLSPSGRPTNQPAAAPEAPSAPAAATAAPSAKPATSSFTAACARVGDQAQRIAWKREGGATQEQQLAERATVLPQSEQAETIAAVYARRGSAPEIRAAIEAECVAGKHKEAEAADLLRQLRKQAGETAAAPAPAPRAAPASPAESAPQASATPASTKPSDAACANLRRPLDDVNSRLRQGGTARTMEFLQTERRRAEASLRSAGCS